MEQDAIILQLKYCNFTLVARAAIRAYVLQLIHPIVGSDPNVNLNYIANPSNRAKHGIIINYIHYDLKSAETFRNFTH